MHIIVVPASPRTAQATIRHLLADASAPTVRGVYRDLSRVPEEFKTNPRFEAVQGDIEDAASLDFSGSDAIFMVQPPVYDERDSIAHTKTVAENVKAAIRKATSIKRLVHLSSMGAQYDHGTGEILTNHTSEVALRDAASEVVFVRAGYFMENWASSIGTVTEESFLYTSVTPVDFAFEHVASQDIGETCAKELLSTSTPKTTPYIFELHGPRKYSSVDVQHAWAQAAGKPTIDLRPVEKEGLAEFFGTFLGPVRAQKYAEMTLGFAPGGIIERDPEPTGEVRKGKTELVEVFKQLLGAA